MESDLIGFTDALELENKGKKNKGTLGFGAWANVWAVVPFSWVAQD